MIHPAAARAQSNKRADGGTWFRTRGQHRVLPGLRTAIGILMKKIGARY
jgi:hypothetical protein